jgi:phage/plasmid primase-like uncharacterized protein
MTSRTTDDGHHDAAAARRTNPASVRTPLRHEEIIEAVVAATHEKGLYFDRPIIVDGRIHRYHVKDDRKSRRNGWAVINSGRYPVGAFGCWKRGIRCKWSAKEVQHYPSAERVELRRERQQHVCAFIKPELKGLGDLNDELRRGAG